MEPFLSTTGPSIAGTSGTDGLGGNIKAKVEETTAEIARSLHASNETIFEGTLRRSNPRLGQVKWDFYIVDSMERFGTHAVTGGGSG